jgi:hypothetical protein
MFNRILATVMISALAACATPYQRDGLRGGYEEVQLDENVFRVSFQGNAYTSPRKVTDYILLRSAELTLEKGFRYFQVAGVSDETMRTAVPLPATATTTVAGNQATTVVSGGGLLGFTFPSGSQTIVCYKEKPATYAFNAEFIAKSLGELYGQSVYIPGKYTSDGEPIKQTDNKPATTEDKPSRPMPGSPDCPVRVVSSGGKPIPPEEQCLR